MLQEYWKQLEMNFFIGLWHKNCYLQGELTYDTGGGLLGEGIGIFPVGGNEQIFGLIPEGGKTLHSSILINANLFYTCYLFTPKLFHNCKWVISICLKSKTNNGNVPAMRKDFRHENISGCSPFLWMGFNCLNATKPLGGDSLLFANKSPEIPVTVLINLKKMKG